MKNAKSVTTPNVVARVALVSAAVVAERLSVAVDTVYRLAHSREIPFVRIAHCIRFAQADVDAFIARCAVTAPAPHL